LYEAFDPFFFSWGHFYNNTDLLLQGDYVYNRLFKITLFIR